eukprot:TRINITY_DN3805_c0_g1_i1.p1 TRINITY_DN3805_c0_g1~~TRINITY_DN3805_c0_g1_i1.p1  ORF type:complete len:2174 (-),score=403.14 TRINITY_DN3805_c0_g1_i1:206-6727(-)
MPADLPNQDIPEESSDVASRPRQSSKEGSLRHDAQAVQPAHDVQEQQSTPSVEHEQPHEEQQQQPSTQATSEQQQLPPAPQDSQQTQQPQTIAADPASQDNQPPATPHASRDPPPPPLQPPAEPSVEGTVGAKAAVDDAQAESPKSDPAKHTAGEDPATPEHTLRFEISLKDIDQDALKHELRQRLTENGLQAGQVEKVDMELREGSGCVTMRGPTDVLSSIEAMDPQKLAVMGYVPKVVRPDEVPHVAPPTETKADEALQSAQDTPAQQPSASTPAIIKADEDPVILRYAGKTVNDIDADTFTNEVRQRLAENELSADTVGKVDVELQQVSVYRKRIIMRGPVEVLSSIKAMDPHRLAVLGCVPAFVPPEKVPNISAQREPKADEALLSVQNTPAQQPSASAPQESPQTEQQPQPQSDPEHVQPAPEAPGAKPRKSMFQRISGFFFKAKEPAPSVDDTDSSTLGHTLRFEGISLKDIDQDVFKNELRQRLAENGLQADEVAKVDMELREGSVCVTMRGPTEVLSSIEAMDPQKLVVMGCIPKVVERGYIDESAGPSEIILRFDSISRKHLHQKTFKRMLGQRFIENGLPAKQLEKVKMELPGGSVCVIMHGPAGVLTTIQAMDPQKLIMMGCVPHFVKFEELPQKLQLAEQPPAEPSGEDAASAMAVGDEAQPGVRELDPARSKVDEDPVTPGHTLRFEGISLKDIDQDVFTKELRQRLTENGLEADQVEQVNMELREGSVCVTMRGPNEVLSSIEAMDPQKLAVMGCVPKAVRPDEVPNREPPTEPKTDEALQSAKDTQAQQLSASAPQESPQTEQQPQPKLDQEHADSGREAPEEQAEMLLHEDAQQQPESSAPQESPQTEQQPQPKLDQEHADSGPEAPEEQAEMLAHEDAQQQPEAQPLSAQALQDPPGVEEKHVRDAEPPKDEEAKQDEPKVETSGCHADFREDAKPCLPPQSQSPGNSPLLSGEEGRLDSGGSPSDAQLPGAIELASTIRPAPPSVPMNEFASVCVQAAVLRYAARDSASSSLDLVYLNMDLQVSRLAPTVMPETPEQVWQQRTLKFEPEATPPPVVTFEPKPPSTLPPPTSTGNELLGSSPKRTVPRATASAPAAPQAASVPQAAEVEAFRELLLGAVPPLSTQERQDLWSRGLSWDLAIAFPNPDWTEMPVAAGSKCCTLSWLLQLAGCLQGAWRGGPALWKKRRGASWEDARRIFHDALRGDSAGLQSATIEAIFLDGFRKLRPWVKNRGPQQDWPSNTSADDGRDFNVDEGRDADPPLFGGDAARSKQIPVELPVEAQSREKQLRRCIAQGGAFRCVRSNRAAGPDGLEAAEAGLSAADFTFVSRVNCPPALRCADLLTLVRNLVIAKLSRLGLFTELVFSTDCNTIYALISAEDAVLQQLALKFGYPLAVDLAHIDPEAAEPCTSRSELLVEVMAADPEVAELLNALRTHDNPAVGPIGSSKSAIPRKDVVDTSTSDAFKWYLRGRLKGHTAAAAMAEANVAWPDSWGKNSLWNTWEFMLGSSPGPEVLRLVNSQEVSALDLRAELLHRTDAKCLNGGKVISHFSLEDRHLIMIAAVEEACDVFQLIRDGYVVDVLPCFGASQSMTQVAGGPIEAGAFGQGLHLYLAWKAHMAAWLVFPAVLGLAAQGSSALLPQEHLGSAMLVYAVLMSAWSGMATDAWGLAVDRLLLLRGELPGQAPGTGSCASCVCTGIRSNSRLSVAPLDINSGSCDAAARQRQQFLGRIRRFHTEVHYRCLYFARRATVAFVCLLLAGSCCIVAIYTRRIDSFLESRLLGITVAAAVAVEVVVLNWMLRVAALRLTRFERHKTRSEFRYAYQVKVICLQFINSFASLVYESFFAEFAGARARQCLHLTPTWLTCWGGSGSMAWLNVQLAVLLLMFVTKAVATQVLPAVLLRSLLGKRPSGKSAHLTPPHACMVQNLDQAMAVPRWGDPEADLSGPGSCTVGSDSEFLTVFWLLVIFAVACPWAGLLSLGCWRLKALADAHTPCRPSFPWRAGFPSCPVFDALAESACLRHSLCRTASWLAQPFAAALLVWPAELATGSFSSAMLGTGGGWLFPHLAPWGLFTALLLLCRFTAGRCVTCTPNACRVRTAEKRLGHAVQRARDRFCAGGHGNSERGLERVAGKCRCTDLRVKTVGQWDDLISQFAIPT